MTEEEFVAENIRLGHAMQSGVAMEQSAGSTDGTPKHLRVGVNAALVEGGAVARLLIRKGLITKEEYFDAIIEGMKREVKTYEARLSKATGAKVTLA